MTTPGDVLAEFKLCGAFDSAREEALVLLGADSTFALCDTETRRQVDLFLSKEASFKTSEFALTQQLQRSLNSNARLNSGITQCISQLFQAKHAAYAASLRASVSAVMETVKARNVVAEHPADIGRTSTDTDHTAAAVAAVSDSQNQREQTKMAAAAGASFAASAVPLAVLTAARPGLVSALPSKAAVAPPIAAARVPAMVPAVPARTTTVSEPLSAAIADADDLSDVSSVHTSDLSSLEDNDEGQCNAPSKKQGESTQVKPPDKKRKLSRRMAAAVTQSAGKKKRN